MGAELNQPSAGSASADTPLSTAGLPALVEALRAAGYRAGAAETVSAGRLLTQLARRGFVPARSRDLAPWLRPVFCTTREEQARFAAIFDPWADGFDTRAAAARRKGTTDPADTNAANQDGSPTKPIDDETLARWAGRAFIAAVIIGVVALMAWPAWQARQSGGQAAPPTAAAPGSASGAAAASAPVAPAAAAAPVVSQPDLQGYFPAVRESRSLRPEIVWPALSLPLLLLLLGGGLPGLALMQGRQRSAREVVLDTAPLAREAQQVLPELDAAVAGRLERHVRAEGDDGGPVARRRRLDARRTVEATLRNHGMLSPRYRAVPVRPSYLMLIDAQDEHDPRGRLFHLWAERMRRSGLVVDIRLFRRGAEASDAGTSPGKPTPMGTDQIGAVASSPRCWRAGQPAEREGGLALDRLEDPPAGQRLVVISEASAWVHADGHWRDWFRRARLRRWPQRVFFTPTEVRDWGTLEERLEAQEHAADPGFLVLPLDEAALDAWSVMLAAGSMPAFSLAEPQRYPRLLASAAFDAFSAPQRAQLDRLIAQLKLYLGDSGFRWLAALAVPPLSRWELTLLLGQALFDHRATHGLRGVPLTGDDAAGQAAAGAAIDPLDTIAEGNNESWRTILGRCYRRLARLPWLRGGHDANGMYHPPGLPEWLRLRLLDELPPAAQEEVREIVGRLLSTLRPDGGDGLALGFEAPSSAGAGKGAGDADRQPRADHLYLGYLSGLTPRQLAMRLPGGWREWLRNQPLPEPGWLARLRRVGGLGGEWLAAAWARLRFRDGMPWAQAALLPAVAGAAIIAVGVIAWRLAETPADALAGGTDRLFFRREMREVTPPAGRGGRTVALNPDGTAAIDIDKDGAVRVWDTATGRITLHIDAARALSARFGTASYLITCDAQGLVRHWSADGQSGDPASTGPAQFTDCTLGTEASATALYVNWLTNAVVLSQDGRVPVRLADRAAITAMLSPNGNWLLTQPFSNGLAETGLGEDVGVTIHRVQAVLSAAASGADPMSAQATLSNQRTLGPMAWAGDSLVALQDDGKAVLELKRFHLDGAGSDSWAVDRVAGPARLALSGDGRYAAVAGADGELVLWDLIANHQISRLKTGSVPIEQLIMSDNGSTVISRTAEGRSRLWRAWQPALASAADLVVQVAISADGRRAAFAQMDGSVTVLGEGSEPITLKEPRIAGQAAFSPDGRRLAISHLTNEAALWPSIDDAIVPVTLTSDATLVHLAFTGDGARLVGVSRLGSITEWRASDGQVIGTWSGQGSGLRQLMTATMRSDGLVAMLMALPGGEGERIVVLRTMAAALREMPAASSWNEMRLKFLDDGNQIAVTERVGSGVWNVTTGAYTAHRSAPPTRSTGMSASRDDDLDGQGALRATVSANGRLTVWSLSDGVAVALPDGTVPQDLRQVRWLPGQRLLVVSSAGAASVLAFERTTDATRKVTWALAGRSSATVPLALGAAADQLAVSADGRRLVAAAFDGSASSLPVNQRDAAVVTEPASAPRQPNAAALPPDRRRTDAGASKSPNRRAGLDAVQTGTPVQSAPLVPGSESAANAPADVASAAVAALRTGLWKAVAVEGHAQAGWWPLLDATAPQALEPQLRPATAWPVGWSVLALMLAAVPGVWALEAAHRRRQRRRLGDSPAGTLMTLMLDAARRGREFATGSTKAVAEGKPS